MGQQVKDKVVNAVVDETKKTSQGMMKKEMDDRRAAIRAAANSISCVTSVAVN
jgi:hypothetical protein